MIFETSHIRSPHDFPTQTHLFRNRRPEMTNNSNTPKHVVTVVTILSDGTVEVSTTNRKWANRLEKLEQEGFAQEIESANMGRHSIFQAEMFLLPLHRENTPEWTNDQLEINRIKYFEKFCGMFSGQQAPARFRR